MNEELLRQRKYGNMIIVISLFMIISFLLFGIFIPIKTYHTYPAIVVKEDSFFLKTYIPKKRLFSFSKSKLFIKGQEREFQIQKLKDLGDNFEILLKFSFQEEEKEENNILEITSLEQRKTLFQRWWGFLKKKVMN